MIAKERNREVYPFTIMNFREFDSDNMYYGVDLKTGEVAELGKFDPNNANILAAIRKDSIQLPDRVVTFSASPNAKYAFDRANKTGLCLEFFKMYDQDSYAVTKAGGGNYPLCWKFIPPDNSDKLMARLPATLPSGFDWAKLKFITTNQTEISYTVPGAGKTIELSLPGGSDGTEYSLHAVYDCGNGNWKQIGRVDVMSRSLKNFNVVIVPVDPAVGTIEAATIQTNLNKIYEKYVISWTVKVDNNFKNRADTIKFTIGDSYQLIAGDAFLSVYSEQQKALNSLYFNYAADSGIYDNKAVYMFMFRNPPDGAGGSLGDMPINRQWGYLFGTSIDVSKLAHELGHGKLGLRHIFDDSECKSSKPGNTKNNLMDYYTLGDTLVCKQWEYMHNRALLKDFFQSDEEAAYVDYCWNSRYKDPPWNNIPKSLKAELNCKKDLVYTQVCKNDPQWDTHYTRHYYLLSKDRIFLRDINYETKDTIDKIYLPEIGKWCDVDVTRFETDEYEAAILYMINEGFGKVAKITGRYVFPFEDFSILMTGEDFDGEEASRIAAGGFLILDAIQVGKVFKLAKSAKILTKSGQAVSVSRRVVKQFAKDVSKDALMDMCAQFVIDFIYESLKTENQNATPKNIAAAAWSEVDIKRAITSGIINFASLNNDIPEGIYNCANEMFSAIQRNEKKEFALDLEKGTVDCVIELGVKVAFKYLKGTPKMKEIITELSVDKNLELAISRLKSISFSTFLEEYISQAIKKGVY